MKIAAASLVALLLAATTSAQTLASVGLFDTGTLVNGQNPYRLVSEAAPGNYDLYVPNSTAWPINGVWLDNTADTKWVAVYRTNQTTTGNIPTVPTGTYTISLGFNLGTYDPRSVSFGFAAAADNTLAVRLNGMLLPNLGAVTGQENYASLGSYIYNVAGTGLHSGLNTLTFELTNGTGSSNNPAGLYVDFNRFTVVPEPATYALCLGGATLLLAAVRRRRFC